MQNAKLSDSKSDYLLNSYVLSEGYTEVNRQFSTNEDDESQQALDRVKSILKPITIFLVIIGWSPITVAPYKRKKYLLARIWNVVWPIIVFILLASTVLLQISSCDKRNRFEAGDHDTDALEDCLRNLISFYIFPAGIILVSYSYMLFLIRREHSEHFANMIERVFLLYNQKRGRLSQSTLKRTVLAFFFVSISWLAYSIMLLVMRSILNIVNNTYDLTAIIANISSHSAVQIGTIIIEPIPIALYDLFYVSQLLSYSVQAQLLIYYFNGLIDRIKFKEVKLQDAIQEIGQAVEILRTLNGKVALAVSLVMINILLELINTIHQLWYTVHSTPINPGFVIYATLTIIRWVVILYVPLIQAMLITINTKRVTHIGLFLKTRPFGYADTPQEDLNYFQLFTSHLALRGKLFSIPIHPWVVTIIVLVQISALVLWLNFDPNITELYWL